MSKPENIPDWPRGPYRWIEGRTLYVSIPFTWNLPAMRSELLQRSMLWDNAVVGGPAVELMPHLLADLPGVSIGHDCPGLLQRINPLATRTTTGCSRRCRFCAIGQGRIEGGGMVELADWPDLPILADNNLLAASEAHFDRVIDRLIRHGWADFNQGLDARLLTQRHAERLAEIRRPIVRLALDSDKQQDQWENAFVTLRAAGIAKKAIRTYCLIGFRDSTAEAWRRCEWVERHGVKALPMWFHTLDALEANAVTYQQARLGWSDYERRRIMQWYYQHKEAVA